MYQYNKYNDVLVLPQLYKRKRAGDGICCCAIYLNLYFSYSSIMVYIVLLGVSGYLDHSKETARTHYDSSLITKGSQQRDGLLKILRSTGQYCIIVYDRFKLTHLYIAYINVYTVCIKYIMNLHVNYIHVTCVINQMHTN